MRPNLFPNNGGVKLESFSRRSPAKAPAKAAPAAAAAAAAAAGPGAMDEGEDEGKGQPGRFKTTRIERSMNREDDSEHPPQPVYAIGYGKEPRMLPLYRLLERTNEGGSVDLTKLYDMSRLELKEQITMMRRKLGDGVVEATPEALGRRRAYWDKYSQTMGIGQRVDVTNTAFVMNDQFAITLLMSEVAVAPKVLDYWEVGGIGITVTTKPNGAKLSDIITKYGYCPASVLISVMRAVAYIGEHGIVYGKPAAAMLGNIWVMRPPMPTRSSRDDPNDVSWMETLDKGVEAMGETWNLFPHTNVVDFSDAKMLGRPSDMANKRNFIEVFNVYTLLLRGQPYREGSYLYKLCHEGFLINQIKEIGRG